MKYTVIICDDNLNHASNLALKIGIAAMGDSGDNPDTEIDLEIGKIAQNALDVIEYLKENPVSGGIYFLDIELSQDKNAMNGIDLAEQVKQLDPRAQIVFVTAYNEYMEMTFERRIGSVDYINKSNPHLQNRLNKTLQDTVRRISKENYSKKMTFSYRLGRIIKNINIDDIYYISTTKAPHKLKLVKNDGTAEFAGDIKSVDKQNKFLTKVSQSYLVNPKNIVQINLKKKEITLSNGDAIKFSRRFTHVMKDITNTYNLKQNNYQI